MMCWWCIVKRRGGLNDDEEKRAWCSIWPLPQHPTKHMRGQCFHCCLNTYPTQCTRAPTPRLNYIQHFTNNNDDRYKVYTFVWFYILYKRIYSTCTSLLYCKLQQLALYWKCRVCACLKFNFTSIWEIAAFIKPNFEQATLYGSCDGFGVHTM